MGGRFEFWTELGLDLLFGGGWITALPDNWVSVDHHSEVDFAANARAWASHMAGWARLLMSFVVAFVCCCVLCAFLVFACCHRLHHFAVDFVQSGDGQHAGQARPAGAPTCTATPVLCLALS